MLGLNTYQLRDFGQVSELSPTTILLEDTDFFYYSMTILMIVPAHPNFQIKTIGRTIPLIPLPTG